MCALRCICIRSHCLFVVAQHHTLSLPVVTPLSHSRLAPLLTTLLLSCLCTQWLINTAESLLEGDTSWSDLLSEVLRTLHDANDITGRCLHWVGYSCGTGGDHTCGIGSTLELDSIACCMMLQSVVLLAPCLPLPHPHLLSPSSFPFTVTPPHTHKHPSTQPPDEYGCAYVEYTHTDEEGQVTSLAEAAAQLDRCVCGGGGEDEACVRCVCVGV